MPRCRLYQAPSAAASLALKKMPPMPVTRFMGSLVVVGKEAAFLTATISWTTVQSSSSGRLFKELAKLPEGLLNRQVDRRVLDQQPNLPRVVLGVRQGQAIAANKHVRRPQPGFRQSDQYR